MHIGPFELLFRSVIYYYTRIRGDIVLLHIMFGYQCDKAVNKNDTREVI